MSEKQGVAMPEPINIEVSAEEKEAEEQGLAEVKAEEVRTKIAEDMGIDPELEPELLDKLVKRDMEQRARLNKTIKQKISWRDKAGKTSKKTEESGGDKPNGDDKDTRSFDEKFEARMAERDLKDLDLSDNTEDKVKKIAKVEGISIREAMKHPYIITVIEAEEKEAKILSGTPNRNNKGTRVVTKTDASKPLAYADFDLKSEDGRKVWEQAKKDRAEYIRNNQ